jgi:tetratricopeptide (TPR) repeat protein
MQDHREPADVDRDRTAEGSPAQHLRCDSCAASRVAWSKLATVRRAIQLLAWMVIAVALPFFGSAFGGAGIALGVATVMLLWVWQWIMLPRTAHRAFAAGRFTNARRRYRLCGALAVAPQRRRAAVLSRLACHIAAGERDAAAALLATIDDTQLDAAERAVWLNNRACLVLATDPIAALALADEAAALRPDVPALQHTRGMALLAVGRIDDAISVLDQMRAGGELATHLEAERCRDLARAWTQKGEPAYAEDYRLRAEALAPSPPAATAP